MFQIKEIVKMRTAVCWSGGKDSTAMLVKLIEDGKMPDRVFFADTGTLFGVGLEYPELYDYISMIEDKYDFKADILRLPDGTFEKWFYGKPKRGKNQDKPRGFPQEFTPCYWSREAKINQLEKAHKNFDKVYIGIAYDELERMNKKDGRLEYPLVSWMWSEQKCVNFLNKRNILNPLYVNFNRLGCWCCPKQGTGSLYVLWKIYPDLWEMFKEIEDENYMLTGRWIKADKSLRDYEKEFERGKIKTFPKYDCWNGCESVKRAFKMKQVRLYDF